LLWRLGVGASDAVTDHELANGLVEALGSKTATIDAVFYDWRGGCDPGAEKYPQEPFRKLASLLPGRERALRHPYWSDAAPCSMYIEEVEAMWDAISTDDDWSPFEAKIAAVRRMGEALAEDGPAST